jgi:hypothetical protein
MCSVVCDLINKLSKDDIAARICNLEKGVVDLSRNLRMIEKLLIRWNQRIVDCSKEMDEGLENVFMLVGKSLDELLVTTADKISSQSLGQYLEVSGRIVYLQNVVSDLPQLVIRGLGDFQREVMGNFGRTNRLI